MGKTRTYISLTQPRDAYKEMQNSLKRKMILLVLLALVVILYYLWSQGRLYGVIDIFQITY